MPAPHNGLDACAGSAPLAGFWLGGFEGADHVNGAGTPLDMVAASGHLARLDAGLAGAVVVAGRLRSTNERRTNICRQWTITRTTYLPGSFLHRQGQNSDSADSNPILAGHRGPELPTAPISDRGGPFDHSGFAPILRSV